MISRSAASAGQLAALPVMAGLPAADIFAGKVLVVHDDIAIGLKSDVWVGRMLGITSKRRSVPTTASPTHRQASCSGMRSRGRRSGQPSRLAAGTVRRQSIPPCLLCGPHLGPAALQCRPHRQRQALAHRQ